MKKAIHPKPPTLTSKKAVNFIFFGEFGVNVFLIYSQPFPPIVLHSLYSAPSLIQNHSGAECLLSLDTVLRNRVAPTVFPRVCSAVVQYSLFCKHVKARASMNNQLTGLSTHCSFS